MSNRFPYTNTITNNRVPLFPGAYIIRLMTGPNYGLIPIYTSMPFFNDNGMTDLLNDKDSQVLVLPGFALQLYNDYLFGTLNSTIDNSGGTELLYRSSPNTSSSCKLFYKSPTGYAEIPTNTINTVTLSVSPSVTTDTVTYNSISYRLYSFTSTASAYTVSLTDTAGIGVNCLYLLIGGGGGGGAAAISGQVAGSGGGGAGAFVYGTLKVVPGATYSITVGAGGAGSQGTTGIGSPSSITRSVSGVVVDSLNVGGGGSGGGPGSAETMSGSYPTTGIGGSSGGPWPGYGAFQDPRNIGNMWAVTGTSGVLTVTAASANTGGNTWGNTGGGGGGGAGGRGAYASATNTNSGGGGGPGATWPVTGGSRFFAAGGGGNNMKDTFPGGGGAGGSSIGGNGGSGTAGAANTGSGGGAKYDGPAGAGGSGICIIAVPVYRLAA